MAGDGQIRFSSTAAQAAARAGDGERGRLSESALLAGAFALALAILVAVAAASYRAIAKAREEAQWVAHTHRALFQIEEVLSILKDAETGQRGYIITGEPRYLQPYQDAIGVLPDELVELRRLTQDNPRQTAHVDVLEALIATRLAMLDVGIEARKRGFAEAQRHIQDGEGKATMDEARRIAVAMKAEESALLHRREADARAAADATIAVIVTGNLASFLIIIAAFYALRRENRQRAAAQRAMQRYAAEVEELYDLAPCGYHSLDAEGVYVRVNRTELEWLGYARDEVIGRLRFTDILAPESLERFRETFPRFKREGRIDDVEFDLVRKDGSLLPVALSATAVRDERGDFVMSRSTMFDITERRRAQHEMRALNEFLDSVIEQLPAMLFVKDADTLRFVRLNRAGEELLGVAREELLGKSDHDFFPPAEADFFAAKDREVLAGGALADILEETVHTRHRGVRVLHTKKIAIAGPGGRPRYLLGISEDITERKLAEQRFRDLLESAPDAMVIADEAGRIVIVNRRAETVFGYRRDQMLGQAVEMLMPDRFREVHPGHRRRYFEAASARAMGEGAAELRGLHHDGSEFPVEISLSPLATENGTLVTAVVRDVTERRRMELALNEHARRLEAANKELEGFSYSVSHDLRVPLRAIDGFSRMLEEDYAERLDGEARRYIGVVRDNAQKMGRLIDDLLAFSRLGRKPLQAAEVDMTALAGAALQELQPPAAARVRVETLPPAVGDAALLKQVWINLLSNALKFSGKRAEPCVQIDGRRQGGEAVYRVRDNGAGFDMQYYDKLFGVFQRLHSVGEFDGTGVGLAIVQRVVARHGGRVWAEGEVDKGASFYFSLPDREGM